MQQQQQTIQGHILPSPQKKQQLSFVKEIPTGAIIKTTSTANIEDATSSNTANNSTGEQGSTKLAGDSTIKILEKSSQLVKVNTQGDSSTNSSIIATEYLPASVKVVHTSGAQQHINASNIRTTLATQMENLEQQGNAGMQQSQQPQQQRINICPTIDRNK